MSLTKVTYSMILGAANNILDFGADPTGVADSTTAIQAAFDLRGAVYIPEGTYRFTSQLKFYGNTEIFGDGPGVSILRWGGSGTVNVMVDSSMVTSTDVNLNIILRDFELDCNNYASTGNSGLVMYRVGNLICDNLYVHHSSGSLFNFGKSQTDTKNIRVTNCRVAYCHQGDGFQGVGTDIVLSNCSAFSCGDTCYALLYDTSATTNPSGLYSKNVIFENCVAEGQWVNNTFTGTGRQQQLGFAVGPFAIGVNAYVTISNCTCDNLYMNVWMIVFSKLKLIGNTFKPHSNTLTGGVRLDGIDNLIVDDNSFECKYTSGGSNFCALLLLAQRNTYGAFNFDASNRYTSISSNVFECDTTPAIVFAADPAYATITDLVMSGNVMTGTSAPVQCQPLTSSGTGIFNRFQITGNTVSTTAAEFISSGGSAAQYQNFSLAENNIGAVLPTTSAITNNVQVNQGYLSTVSAADGVATTVFALVGYHTVQISAYVQAGNVAFESAGVFITNAGSSRIAWKSDGANCTLTLSGNNVQVTQSGVGTQTVYVAVRYIS